ncbi:hypothetical protein QBC46DRAFT_310637 [Diplogelasinospora grovesii]|uniref:Uncharacterized protein n=1 Tax=Diplogelasinospora grovesii TaxID=303347 RepID=A0AAN6S5G0_9PEZI|nr:hypothetical protein QBC46DRAFT_310637 [Diplogelasinospora grovesii]
MPRFPVTFGRRKSTADNLDNVPAEPSFRVLERSEVVGGKSFDAGKTFDGGARTNTKTYVPPKTSGSDVTDNIFAGLKPNRYVLHVSLTRSGSGSSNTTKAGSTDNSSRHSNASTAPSSADLSGQEEWRNVNRKVPTDIPVPPIPKSSSTGFLKAAGRTFSFGGQKKHLPPVPAADESQPPSLPPPTPPGSEPRQPQGPGRARATTTSTSTTVTPPTVDGDFNLDLGGDFGKMLLGGYDKRASVATLKDDQNGRQAPRSLTGTRLNQPTPIDIDKTTKVEPAAHSWSSQHSNEQLLTSTSPPFSPPGNDSAPPPVPRHGSPIAGKMLRPSASPEVNARNPLLGPPSPNIGHEDGEDEEARLLKDSLSTVTKFMSGGRSNATSGTPSSRYRRNEDTFSARNNSDDDSLFDTNHTYSSKSANRFTLRKTSPPSQNKVMTPAQFEKYRKDKERQDKERQMDAVSDTIKADDDEDNYEDDEDDLEKAQQQAKQRRKQEAHMAVYRQQMMKVTGESSSTHSSRPSLQISFSTPNLPNLNGGPSPGANTSENSDEDEEVPLAILAAHGFPNKNRPPTRLSTMMSNPNLRAAQQPSYQRPVSAVGEPSAAGGTRLPAFARNLPQDPFLGAGLVRNTVRESFALGGGSAAPGHPGAPLPPGGLVGVIASEERSRAMRRGSPHIDSQKTVSLPGAAGFDPVAGIPPHMMYQNRPNSMMISAGDQAQIQMTQQMQQFMQMQMQFMQMMAGQNGSPSSRPNGHMAAQSMGNLSAMNGMPGMGGMPAMPGMMGMPGMGMGGNESMLDIPSARGDAHFRTMSMVQPSSASWIQPAPQNPGFAPSIRIQGGYAPSIAPSERSNVGLPGRYRPVSHAPPPPPQPTALGHIRKSSTMSGAINWSENQSSKAAAKSGNASDDDDEQGWEAMKAKREKKKSIWRSKKSIGGELSAFLNS